MIDILFRGFYENKNGTEKVFYGGKWYKGEWVEGDLRQDRDLGTAYILGFNYHSSGEGLQRKNFCINVIPKTVGQYVGNGTELWQGDIVKSGNLIGVVKLGVYGYNLGFYIDWSKKSNPHNMYRQDLMFWVNDGIEVIGNVHSNPELLEVE